MRLLLLGILVVLSSWVSGCSTAGTEGAVVPGNPPDSVPSDLYHDSVMVVDGSGYRWSRSVVGVGFAPDLDLKQRAQAIEAVSGEVVGGIRLLGEGYYLVRVPHDGSLDGVDSAIARLKLSPGVLTAIRLAAPS